MRQEDLASKGIFQPHIFLPSLLIPEPSRAGSGAIKTWLRGHTEVIPFPFLSCRPYGPLNCHVPTFPGPDGPGYYLTALRALCVWRLTEWEQIVSCFPLTNCDQHGFFLAAQAGSHHGPNQSTTESPGRAVTARRI